MRKKNPSSKNWKINTRIAVSTTLAIVIPILLIAASVPFLMSAGTEYLGISTVTTKSYSAINQIQWENTISSLSTELTRGDREYANPDSVAKFIAPIEKLGYEVSIEKNGDKYYASKDIEEIYNTAKSIISCDKNKNIYYFSENGMVIIDRAIKGSDTYIILVCNSEYNTNNITTRYNTKNIISTIFSRTGIFVLLIVLIFILSFAILSFITAKTIVIPMEKLAKGANEIAQGNLDYRINYSSTNELGKTVDAFNEMSSKLKQSMVETREIDRQKKEMTAGLAHDLRTPLTSIKGYVEGLRDGIADTPEKQVKYLDTIYNSTITMNKMLDDLLDVSRMELGELEVKPESILIGDFIDDCTEDLRIVLEEKGFDFGYDKKCPNDISVLLDTDRFSRVVNNIISNSIKYQRENIKGKISLSTREYDKSVIISISDNGIGVDDEAIKHIFDPFYRADKSRTKVKDGSGIGLAVCKTIVELHNGHIWATPVEDGGLTINISLPKEEYASDEKNINS